MSNPLHARKTYVIALFESSLGGSMLPPPPPVTGDVTDFFLRKSAITIKEITTNVINFILYSSKDVVDGILTITCNNQRRKINPAILLSTYIFSLQMRLLL